MALSGASFACATVFGKLAFRAGASVGSVVSSRLAVGTLVLAILVAARRPPSRVPKGRWPALLLLGVLSAGVGSLLFGAVRRIPASTTTLLLYAYPAIVAAASVAMRRDRLSAGKAAALVVGLAGVALVLGFPVERLDPIGAALAAGAAFALAAYVIGAQTAAAGMHPFVVGAIVLGIATLLYLPIAPFQGGVWTAGPEWWWVLLVGGFTGIGIAAFLGGLSRLGPILASIGSTIEPPTAVLLGAIVLGERLGMLQLVGGAMVIAAIVALPLMRR